ncbi:hypothetical protein AB2M95_02425 [Pseudomonas chlororaphis]|uniref:hypothetical protein n=1 Tax=Pseudomonas chlororaphis TaxID=587753 RepID=UPI0034635B82
MNNELRALLERVTGNSHQDSFRAIGELRALLAAPVYPQVKMVKSHKHTCACVAGDSGVCDCGAVVDGVAVPAAQPVPPAGGEPKVLGYSVKGNRYAIRLTKGELLELCESYTGDALIELVDRSHLSLLQAEVERLSQALRREQNEHCTTVNARDNAEQVADEMACKIGKIFRVEIGEHSNMNCPWGVAIGVLDGEYETDSDTERERDALRSELDALKAQPQGEPVAFQWRCKTVNEGSQWRHWVDCTEEDYNKTIENPGPNPRGIIREARKLYTRPAEPPAPVAVVLPERPRADEDEYERMTDYEKGLLHGGIELWDKISEAIRLNSL